MNQERLAEAEAREIAYWEQSEVTAVLRYRHLGTAEAGERIVDEIVADGAEFLDAPMTKRLEFQINQDGHMITDEGERSRDIWQRGLRAEKKHAMRDPRFWPVYYRSRHELEEQIEFEDEIIPSSVYNMLLTFTPYAQDMEDAHGPEFMDTRTTFNRDRKYGLMRFLYQTGSDTAEVASISIENSHHLEAFRNVAAGYGLEIPEDVTPTEMLGYRLRGCVEPKERFDLEQRLVREFDQELTRLIGGEFKQGRPKGKATIEAHSFVVANQDILAVYAEEMKRLANTSGLNGKPLRDQVRIYRYSYLAKLHERYQNHDATRPLLVRQVNSETEYQETYDDMMDAGRRAAELGRRILGCGTALDPDTILANMTQDQFEQALNTPETRYHFNKKMFCLVCQSPPKTQEPAKLCGPCGICRKCDTKLQKKAA